MPLRDAAFVAKEVYGDKKKTARVYEAARIGIFPPGVVVRIGRQVRFDENALREWMRNGGCGKPNSNSTESDQASEKSFSGKK